VSFFEESSAEDCARHLRENIEGLFHGCIERSKPATPARNAAGRTGRGCCDYRTI
jgi:hypothetical protein